MRWIATLIVQRALEQDMEALKRYCETTQSRA